jgi:hypothetical protein
MAPGRRSRAAAPGEAAVRSSRSETDERNEIEAQALLPAYAPWITGVMRGTGGG